MNCPSCGERTPASLSNCARCGARVGEGSTFDKTSSREEETSNPWEAEAAADRNTHVVDGKTMIALLAGFAVLGGLVYFVVPMYYESQGKESHYRVTWCTSTSGLGGTDPAEIEAQGFTPSNRMVPGHSRLADSSRHRSRCFSRDYGQERPSYSSIDTRREYRQVSTYYAGPEQPEVPPATQEPQASPSNDGM